VQNDAHVLLDGNGIYARCYWAAASDPGYLAENGATRIAFRTLASILRGRGSIPRIPTHLLACWDGKAKRDKHRGAKPPGYEAEMEEVFKPLLAACFGGAQIKLETEADDCVATAAARSNQSPNVSHVYVVSGDKDLAQLVQGNVFYWSLIEKCLLSPTFICNKFKVKNPTHIPVALAIIGDSVDGIAGVHKWGAKKLAKIFEDVTYDWTLTDVANHAASFMNSEQLAQFEECLMLTALNTQLEGVPEPGLIVTNPEPLFERGWLEAAEAVKSASGEVGQNELDLEVT
jgi:5'-3' exonuclease